ncbi:MAG: Fis family transcriptional regulator [Myxococcales bacterium]|nr:Fis family transcriptional regulator [Myxococcales bacterium]
MTAPNPHLGSDFDDFLAVEGLLAATESLAIKRVIAWQIAEAMKTKHMTKAELARQMGTSRAAVDRLLDPNNESVTLLTLDRAAHAVGRNLIVQLG